MRFSVRKFISHKDGDDFKLKKKKLIIKYSRFKRRVNKGMKSKLMLLVKRRKNLYKLKGRKKFNKKFIN